MKPVSTVMILRPSFRVLNRNHSGLPCSRKRAHWSKFNIKMILIVFFFDLEEIACTEFVPRNTIVNSEYYSYYSIKGMMCLKNGLRNGRIVSPSILTTLRVTHLLWYGNFCQMKTLQCVLIHPVQQIWRCLTPDSPLKSKWPWKVNALNWFRISKAPQQYN